MSFRATVADPFRRSGRDRLDRSEFVVGLSLDRDWFSPDEAEQVAAAAVECGLLDSEGDALEPTFDPGAVEPTDDAPGLDDLPRSAADRGPFETVLDRCVDAGDDRQETVAAINALQNRLDVTAPCAAILHGRRAGIEVDDLVDAALADLGLVDEPG